MAHLREDDPVASRGVERLGHRAAPDSTSQPLGGWNRKRLVAGSGYWT